MELNILPVLQVAGIGVARSFFGWAENALDEKSHGGTKITKFEVSQLAGTVVRVSVLTVAGYYAITGIWGTDITVLTAGAGAFVTDFVFKRFKK